MPARPKRLECGKCDSQRLTLIRGADETASQDEPEGRCLFRRCLRLCFGLLRADVWHFCPIRVPCARDLPNGPMCCFGEDGVCACRPLA